MQIYSSNGTGYDSVIEPSYLTQFENQSSGKSPKLIEKSVIENGEYLASEDNADGYSKVTVDVSGGGSEPFTINMTYSNGSYSVDKTVSEVFDAVQNNRDNIIIIADDPKNSSKKYIGKNISVEFVNPFADKHIAHLIFSASLPVTDSLGFTLISFQVQAADMEGDSITGTCQIGVISVKSGSITITPEFY